MHGPAARARTVRAGASDFEKSLSDFLKPLLQIDTRRHTRYTRGEKNFTYHAGHGTPLGCVFSFFLSHDFFLSYGTPLPALSCSTSSVNFSFFLSFEFPPSHIHTWACTSRASHAEREEPDTWLVRKRGGARGGGATPVLICTHRRLLAGNHLASSAMST